MSAGTRNRYFLRMLSKHPKDCAQEVLGHLLVRKLDCGEMIVVRVTEVEAYHQDEPASHSHRGRTPRNAPMFLPPGFAYVYFIYGNHFCLNVSCMKEGVGAAILIRGAEAVTPKGLRLGGPGLICKSLEIDRRMNSVDLLDSSSPIFLNRGRKPVRSRVISAPRIGIKKAKELMWRFILES